jgi:hypothetical protein
MRNAMQITIAEQAEHVRRLSKGRTPKTREEIIRRIAELTLEERGRQVGGKNDDWYSAVISALEWTLGIYW